MFEKFTEKAVNVVIEAQNIASGMKSPEVTPEHLLLAMVSQAKGVSLRLLRMYHLDIDNSRNIILKYCNKNTGKVASPPFNNAVKEILKRAMDIASDSGNQNILFEHLFLSLIRTDTPVIKEILSKFDFNILECENVLNKLVQKKIKKLEHPESEQDDLKISFEANYESVSMNDVFERASVKASAQGYEILGTEQILASILENQNLSVNNILNSNGLNADIFAEKLLNITSRKSEFEDKKYVFTPNAFSMMNLAMQIAKELGDSEVTPEHIVLSMLKLKKGLAYEIIKSINLDENSLLTQILNPIEKQMSETLMIMKIAKEEARRIGRNVVGTEMLLLGILGEGTNIACEILNNLEVTMKDARAVVERLIGFGNEYFESEMIFTNRAKRVLEKAWISAKRAGKQKIEAEDLLLAIIGEGDSVAMKVLDNLGADVAEIKQGIQGKK